MLIFDWVPDLRLPRRRIVGDPGRPLHADRRVDGVEAALGDGGGGL